MKEVLGKFSISHILRQFFCGVVFFVPFFCISGTKGKNKIHSLNEWLQVGFFNHDWSTPKVAALCALACVIGTIIYHLEKNLWSYPLQCLFERAFSEKLQINHKDKEVKLNGTVPAALLLGSLFSFIILFSIVLSHFNTMPDWISKFYPLIAGVLFFVYLLFIWLCLVRELLEKHQYYSDGFQNVLRRTRAMWVMEELNEKEIKSFLSEKDTGKVIVHNSLYRDALACAAIAKRLASWSDYIHSVQCMCFAWLLGIGAVIGLFSLENANIQHVSFLLASVFFAVGIILLEAVFEYHRYHHLVYITAHFYRIHSSLDSFSKRQQSSLQK